MSVPKTTLTDMLIDRNNMNRAYKKVKANNGACGIDGMNISELFSYLKRNKDDILYRLKNGTYTPSPLKVVYIPKDNGDDVRKLSIPTLADRVVLQAVSQVINPLFEPVFSEYSHGFRTDKSIMSAISQCRQFIVNGNSYAVHLDLENFFDNINHNRLLQILSEKINDDNLLKLIKSFLNSNHSAYGLSQGSPLSPLLSNVYLNQLDIELSSRNIPFVRYADDCIMFFKDIHEAVAGIKSIAPFIENELDLKINYSKTRISHVPKVSFLGYGFYKYKGGCRIKLSDKTIRKVKNRVKNIFSSCKSFSAKLRELSLFVHGWIIQYSSVKLKSITKMFDTYIRQCVREQLKIYGYKNLRNKQIYSLGVCSFHDCYLNHIHSTNVLCIDSERI